MIPPRSPARRLRASSRSLLPRLLPVLLPVLLVVVSPARGHPAAALDLGTLIGLLRPPVPAPGPGPELQAAPRPDAGGQVAPPAHPPLPADSGSGRRVVYGNAEQRVWLVEEDGNVAGSWLVSGHDDFPRPGAYHVYSRSRHSRSGSVTFEYMVRFTRSGNLAVGFHSIPVYRSGRPIQPESDLGRPLGRGCVRQRLADAAILWDWAPEGTRVVVTP